MKRRGGASSKRDVPSAGVAGRSERSSISSACLSPSRLLCQRPAPRPTVQKTLIYRLVRVGVSLTASGADRPRGFDDGEGRAVTATEAPPDETVVHVLWINAGLSCDGDSVALTAATQPSIEEIALGALPGLPKIAVHWPLIDFECGPVGGADDFIEWFFKADRGELDPFVLVVEGSIPNEAIKTRGLLVRVRQQPRDRPAHDDQRVARPPGPQGPGRAGRRHLRLLRRHPRHGRQPDRGHGRARLPGLGLEVQGRHPDRVRARLPHPPRQPVRDHPLPALPGDRPGADDPPRRLAAAAVAVRRTPCTRAATGPATTSRATSPPSTGRPKCIVKLGCWGPVVKCNVPKRGWINGVGGCPNVGGICIGCTMPGFPDKFMPFMDEPPGARVSTMASGLYGGAIRGLRKITAKTLDEEPKWRTPGRELLTGYKGTWR